MAILVVNTNEVGCTQCIAAGGWSTVTFDIRQWLDCSFVCAQMALTTQKL